MEHFWSAPQAIRMRSLREALHLSIPALARKLDVHRDTIRNWERESAPIQPTEEHLQVISGFFKIGIDDLRAPIVLPPFAMTGVTLLRALPVSSRATLVIEKVIASLKEKHFDYHSADKFGFEQLCQELADLHNIQQLASDQARRRLQLIGWGKSANMRALVLSAFHGLEETDWVDYVDLLTKLKDYCLVVLVQAISPFHIKSYRSRGSWYEAACHEIQLPLPPDDQQDLFVDDLLTELPYCCRELIRAIIWQDKSTLATPTLCFGKLRDAGIVTASVGGLGLREEAWRVPWRKRLETNDGF